MEIDRVVLSLGRAVTAAVARRLYPQLTPSELIRAIQYGGAAEEGERMGDIVDARWALADRVSDRIVDVVNKELDAAMDSGKPGQMLQVLAGHALAMLALMRTMPQPMPPSIDAVRKALSACIADLQHAERIDG